MNPDTAAVASRLVMETAGMFQRLTLEFAEPSKYKVAALEDVAVVERMKENMTVVEAIAVAEGMKENMTVVEVIAVAEGMKENMTVVVMGPAEEDMTVEARGHYTCMIAAALGAEENVVAAAAVAMEIEEGSRAVAGTMAHWQLDPGEKRP